MKYRRWRILLFALVAALSGTFARAQDSSFLFETTGRDNYAPAYLGNGLISLVTTPLATDAARSYLAGVYDHTPGDTFHIASAPAWNEIDIAIGESWLNAGPPPDAISNYRQRLNMFDGTLETGYRWSAEGKAIRIDVQQFVSRDQPQLAAIKITITPGYTGDIKLRFPLRNWPPPHRYDLARIRTLDPEAQKDSWKLWYPGWLHVDQVEAERQSLGISAHAPGTNDGVTTAVSVATPRGALSTIERHPDGVEADVTLHVQAGQSYTFEKFAAVVTNVAPGDPLDDATRKAESARNRGWELLLAAHTAAWHKLWQSDIVIEGDPQIQRMVHSMLFYLYGSAREDMGTSIGPMGLSSAGYFGHIFWDADTFMFPALVLLHPELARPLVAFRSRTRPAAVENARKNGFKGAMYPWEAAPDGTECTPRFAFQNATSENHVNGDVALAAWQYWLATRDHPWLQNDAWPVLRDTADFWLSRVTFDPKRKQYVIGNVVAENESEIGVTNDAYTNAIAQKNLQVAIAAARALRIEPHPKWQEVADNMYLPEGDSALLWYPLNRPHSTQQTHRAIDAILARIHQNRSGGMMGTEFYPIMAAQIDDSSAIGQLLRPLSVPYLRPPFNAIAETPRNQNISFITGAGAFLQQFLFGYTGLRLTDKGLERSYSAVLPPGVSRIELRSISVAGKVQTLTFDAR